MYRITHNVSTGLGMTYAQHYMLRQDWQGLRIDKDIVRNTRSVRRASDRAPISSSSKVATFRISISPGTPGP